MKTVAVTLPDLHGGWTAVEFLLNPEMRHHYSKLLGEFGQF